MLLATHGERLEGPLERPSARASTSAGRTTRWLFLLFRLALRPLPATVYRGTGTGSVYMWCSGCLPLCKRK